ncbi:MAG: hypothetical protein IJM19_03610 [Ruminococcus sp.]|nr:hypothetical protein [Ruminococcus sp.]MBR6385545.1 hypothetical protein [Ruminococcus sp.]
MSIELLNGSLAAMYIDPATTSYIIQIVIGVVIALGTVMGIFWSKIKRLFKGNKNEETSPAAMKSNNDGKAEITAADLLDDDDDE